MLGKGILLFPSKKRQQRKKISVEVINPFRMLDVLRGL
jgi:hypothetical protein